MVKADRAEQARSYIPYVEVFSPQAIATHVGTHTIGTDRYLRDKYLN